MSDSEKEALKLLQKAFRGYIKGSTSQLAKEIENFLGKKKMLP